MFVPCEHILQSL
uniref:Uncharacterized protein n=1 Tax=Anguilla anguilla TaxID=7936 RepID=A0A0E9P7K5_ANGAN